MTFGLGIYQLQNRTKVSCLENFWQSLNNDPILKYKQTLPRCLHIPCGLVVRIWNFHRHGPGSISDMGIFLSTFKILFKDVSYSTR